MSIDPRLKLYEEFAIIARALGNAHRLDLLHHLAQGPRGVEALASRAGLSTANTSQHLQVLKRAGLVTARREGRFILYATAGDAAQRLTGALFAQGASNLAAADKAARDWFTSRDAAEPVTRAELLTRIREDRVTVLDVRPHDEFATCRVAGAVNIPLDELEARLPEIAGGGEVVAYCRGPWCALAYEAVALLRRHGLAARRLEDGLPQWRLAGLPVEKDGAAKPSLHLAG